MSTMSWFLISLSFLNLHIESSGPLANIQRSLLLKFSSSFPPVNKITEQLLPRLLLAMIDTRFSGCMLYYAVQTEMPPLIHRHPVSPTCHLSYLVFHHAHHTHQVSLQNSDSTQFL